MKLHHTFCTLPVLLFLFCATAQDTLYFRENFEGVNPMRFRSCGEPHIYSKPQAEKQNVIKFHREAITAQEEAKAHGDVRAFALDVTLDKLTGRWGGSAGWTHEQKLNIQLDKPVWLTAYVFPEEVPPNVQVRIGVIFNATKAGKPITGGCLTFDALGVDADGWLVFQKDVAELVAKGKFENAVMTGWQLTLLSHPEQPFANQRVKVFLDDVSVSSKPEQINIVSGEAGRNTDIVPGPHTVGYASLHEDYPSNAKNRIWNSSFENGFFRFYRGVSFAGTENNELFAALPEESFVIRNDKSAPHGNAYLEIVREPGKPFSAMIRTMPVNIEEGMPYTLSFYAKSSRNGEVMQLSSPLHRQFSLTTQWERYETYFPVLTGHQQGSKKFPGRVQFSLQNNSDASIMLDALQLEQGKLTDFEYPEMVSLSVRPVNHTGIYLPEEEMKYAVTLFNGLRESANIELKRVIRDFSHRVIEETSEILQLGSGEGKILQYALPGSFRHYKIFVSTAVDGKKSQHAVTAASRVDNLTQTPDREFFGQLGIAGPNPQNFANVLELNRLLGVHWMLIYNNMRLDWQKNWRTDAGGRNRREFVLNTIKESGFEPESAIYPFPQNIQKDEHGVEVVNENDLAEIGAWAEELAATHKNSLMHFEVFGEYMMNVLPPRAENVRKILPVVYRALKKGNPGCQVAAFGEDNMPAIVQELDAHFKLGSLQFCDMVTLHPYWIARQNQEGLDLALGKVRTLIDRYVEGKPFSGGEAGHRAVDILHYDDIEPESLYYPLHCTELEQAERTVREHLIALGNGFERYIAFYTYAGPRFFSFSYVQDDNGLRPKTVFPAYNFMVGQLSGAKLEKVISRPENNFRCYLFTKGDDTFSVLWRYAPDHSAKTVSLELNPQKLKAFNLVGEPMTFSGSRVQFGLDGKPVYLHAGNIPRADFFRAVENLQMDSISVSVTPEDAKHFSVTLQNGMKPRHGILTVTGEAEKILELKAAEYRKISIPVRPGKSEVHWHDAGEDITRSIHFLPVADFASELKLGEESRCSRFNETVYGGENDLSAVVRISYDADRLLLNVIVKDDIFSAPYSSKNRHAMIWANDALQLGFDNMEEPEYKELSVSLTSEGPEMFVSLGQIDTTKIEFAGKTEAPYHHYSLTIPWSALWKNFAPSAKPQIRFNIAVIDNDGEPVVKPAGTFVGDKQCLLFTPGIVNGKTSNEFAWMLFENLK